MTKALKYGQIGFYQFIFTRIWNLIYLLSAFFSTIILWVIFKSFYPNPNPNIIFDSYHYLNATVSKADVNAWPIGYSWFLRFIGQFSHSATFLVSIQYILLNFSLFLFFFTLRYFFHLPIWGSFILVSFFLFNPIFVFTSNLILSDSIFTTLSILWLTNIFWIVAKPKNWMILSHALIVLLAFTIRYNALYYPFVAIVVFLFVKKNIAYKISAIFLQLLLIGAFITFTIFKMQSIYGVKQFSPFGGWKLANDALYMYKNVKNLNSSDIPKTLLPLELHVQNYFKTNNDTIDLFTPDPTSGSFYMYIHPSPLLTYRDLLYGSDNSSLNLNTFSKMGPLYQEYGIWLIFNNFSAFSKYFIWPNIQRYFIAPHEVYADRYNPFLLRKDSLGMSTRRWFNLKSISSKPPQINFRYNIFMNYPIANLMIHISFLFIFFELIFNINTKELQPTLLYGIIAVGTLWIAGFLFNILAAAVVLRYQIFISIVEFSFSIIFLSGMMNDNSFKKEKQLLAN